MSDVNLYDDHKVMNVCENPSMIDMNRVVERRVKGTDIIPSMIVGEVGETHPDVDPSVSGDGIFLGVAWKHANEKDIPADWDNGDAFADNVRILVILPHAGALIMNGLISPKASNANDITGNETLSVSAETGGDGLLDVGDGAALNVGKAVSEQAVTVGATYNERVVYNY